MKTFSDAHKAGIKARRKLRELREKIAAHEAKARRCQRPENIDCLADDLEILVRDIERLSEALDERRTRPYLDEIQPARCGNGDVDTSRG